MYNILKVIAKICNTIIYLMGMIFGILAVKDGNNSNLMRLAFLFRHSVLCIVYFATIRIVKNNVSDDKDDGTVRTILKLL